jgi:hypothetical protein
MPRRFDDLDGAGSSSPSTVDGEAAQELLDIIEWMRSCGSFEWAGETLTGIYDTVHERKYASAAQRRAIENIWHGRFKGNREFGDCD